MFVWCVAGRGFVGSGLGVLAFPFVLWGGVLGFVAGGEHLGWGLGVFWGGVFLDA